MRDNGLSGCSGCSRFCRRFGASHWISRGRVHQRTIYAGAGERKSDCREERRESYEGKLHQLIADVRADLQIKDLPFIVGNLPEQCNRHLFRPSAQVTSIKQDTPAQPLPWRLLEMRAAVKANWAQATTKFNESSSFIWTYP
ncbi:MAG: hypothetical protein H8E73_05875 [Planctomycetes bacterium]|nr:hypothetical protein [Planctomycetota bacterium]